MGGRLTGVCTCGEPDVLWTPTSFLGTVASLRRWMALAFAGSGLGWIAKALSGSTLGSRAGILLPAPARKGSVGSKAEGRSPPAGDACGTAFAPWRKDC